VTINFTFSSTTGNSTLRKHLVKEHEDEHERVCAANGMTTQRARMEQLTADASTGPPHDPDGRPRPQFSRQTFLRHIINFVVADDQVCLKICETYPVYLLLA
jgi:hypothetical protein